MRIGTETELWETARPVVEEAGWLGRRYEDRSQPGHPDAMLSGPAADGRWYAWVELKIDRLRYERGQLPWALTAAKAGERVLTLLWRNRERRAELYDTGRVAMTRAFGDSDPEPAFAGTLRDAIWAIGGTREGPRHGPDRELRA